MIYCRSQTPKTVIQKLQILVTKNVSSLSTGGPNLEKSFFFRFSQLCVDVALKTNFTLDFVGRKICGRCVNCIAVFLPSKIQRGVVL